MCNIKAGQLLELVQQQRTLDYYSTQTSKKSSYNHTCVVPIPKVLGKTGCLCNNIAVHVL